MARKKAPTAAQFTTTPPTPPTRINCPDCDALLAYTKTVLNGVYPVERWDQYVCSRCRQNFEFRIRTKNLRRVDH